MKRLFASPKARLAAVKRGMPEPTKPAQVKTEAEAKPAPTPAQAGILQVKKKALLLRKKRCQDRRTTELFTLCASSRRRRSAILRCLWPLALPKRSSRVGSSRAMWMWCEQTAYLEALANGGARLVLDGIVAGEVSADHRQDAAERLAGRARSAATARYAFAAVALEGNREE
jgi:hypothetical protein